MLMWQKGVCASPLFLFCIVGWVPVFAKQLFEATVWA